MRLRLLALVAVLLLSGCTVPDRDDDPPAPGTTGEPGPADIEGNVTATFARASLNATAGHNVTFLLTLRAKGTAERVHVQLRGEGVEGMLPDVRALGTADVTVFLPVTVAPDARLGAHPLSLVLLDPEGRETMRRAGAATVHVVAGEGGYAPGDAASVVYTGRIAETGRTFNTNDPLLQDLEFAVTEEYSFNPSLLEVTSLPRPSVVVGFHEAVLGMVPGESRTVTFPAEKGYGNATSEDRIPREEILPRRETLPLPEANVTLEDFASFLSQTDQGVPDDYAEGDHVLNALGSDTIRYRILNKTATNVELRMDVAVGERYTVHGIWPKGSEVESFTGTNVTFYTTPTVQEGDAFTYHEFWPQMSSLARLDNTSIVVRHDPPEGYRFTHAPNPYAAPMQGTVHRLEEDAVVVQTLADHHLAGKALTFDVTLAELRKGGNAA